MPVYRKFIYGVEPVLPVEEEAAPSVVDLPMTGEAVAAASLSARASSSAVAAPADAAIPAVPALAGAASASAPASADVPVAALPTA
eukprot:154470-Alexandrium_andersonii.AAC.1